MLEKRPYKPGTSSFSMNRNSQKDGRCHARNYRSDSIYLLCLLSKTVGISEVSMISFEADAGTRPLALCQSIMERMKLLVFV